MKRRRFSVEQIMAVLKQAEMGTPVADLSLDKVMLHDVLSKNGEAFAEGGRRELLNQEGWAVGKHLVDRLC